MGCTKRSLLSSRTTTGGKKLRLLIASAIMSVLIMTILFINAVFALPGGYESTQLQSLTIQARILDNGTVIETLIAEFSSTNTLVDSIILPVPSGSRVLSATDLESGECLDHTFADLYTTKRRLKLFLNSPSKSGRVGATLSTESLVEDTESGKSFVTERLLDAEVDQFSYQLILPEHALIPLDSGRTAIAPAATMTTDGMHILLDWAESNVSSFYAYALFSTGDAATQTGIPVLWLVLIAGVLVLSLVGGLFLGARLFGKRGGGETVRIVTQNPDHKRMLEIIDVNPGITQRNIVEMTGFSKAKVSRLTRTLKRAGMLKVLEYGRTNKLYIKKENTLVSGGGGTSEKDSDERRLRFNE